MRKTPEGFLSLWIRKMDETNIHNILRCPYWTKAISSGGFMGNYMPTGDAKSLYERECNEGRYKRSHQKEYLKLDLQESKDLVGKIHCSYWGIPPVVRFLAKPFLFLCGARSISGSNINGLVHHWWMSHIHIIHIHIIHICCCRQIGHNNANVTAALKVTE